MTYKNHIINQRTEESLNIFWINLVLVLIAVSAPWFNLTVSGHELIKSYFSYCGLGILACISIFHKTSSENFNFNFNFLKLSLLILFVFGTLSIFWSNNIDFTVNKWLLWLAAFFSFIIASNLSLNINNLVKLSWGLLLASGCIALIGILQYLVDPFSLTQEAPPASTFANRNIAAQPLILTAPLFMFLLLSRHTEGVKVWLVTILTSFIFIYLFYTTSRGAWLSILIEFVLLVFYFIHYKFKKYNWITWNKNKRYATILGLILIFVFCSLTPEGFINMFDLTSKEASSIISSVENLSSEAVSEKNVESWRYEIWKTALNMANASPFIGSGLGTYSHNLANEGYSTWLINNTFRVHNDILELLVETGLIGIIIFGFIVFSIVFSIINILKNINEELHLLNYILFIALFGSFVNLQFSFPYQMPVPLLIFGLYCGLISKQFDNINIPIKTISFKISRLTKKILSSFLAALLILIFYFTYFDWIKVYHQLNKVNLKGDFSEINIVNTAIYNPRVHSTLYNLGGKYFRKGRYIQSNAIDQQFLSYWPNHLDVLFRHAYAMHKLGQNDKALELSIKLKELEPSGLYNAYIVQMFVYSSLNKTIEFEEIFNELLAKPEEFLKLNDDTYRLLVFFSLGSKNLLKNTEYLYKKYFDYHGYNCEVTNNIAIYYFNLEDFVSSAEYVNLAYTQEPTNNPKCLNPTLVKLLKEKKLLKFN